MCVCCKQKVVVKFHRDRSKPASKDVAELIFQISQNRIEVTYHLEDDKIVPNFDIFEKPSNLDDPFPDKMASSFQVWLQDIKKTHFSAF